MVDFCVPLRLPWCNGDLAMAECALVLGFTPPVLGFTPAVLVVGAAAVWGFEAGAVDLLVPFA